MALTKADLSQTLMEAHSFTKKDAKELVELLFEEMRIQLENGVSIKVSSFGNFEIRDKNERPGRNPKTGVDVPISARRVVTFKPGQKLRARIEGTLTPEAEEELEERS